MTTKKIFTPREFQELSGFPTADCAKYAQIHRCTWERWLKAPPKEWQDTILSKIVKAAYPRLMDRVNDLETLLIQHAPEKYFAEDE